jgi:hypothetical protein
MLGISTRRAWDLVRQAELETVLDGRLRLGVFIPDRVCWS